MFTDVSEQPIGVIFRRSRIPKKIKPMSDFLFGFFDPPEDGANEL
jgi:hypothetical protein